MNHLYFHSSNLNILRDLQDDELFEAVYMYSKHESKKCNPFEFGRIKTSCNHFHFLIGSIPNKNCPWCGSETVFKTLSEKGVTDPSIHCLQCINCGSRGPLLNVILQFEHDETLKNEIINMITQRYAYRKQWDSDFLNPYQELT